MEKVAKRSIAQGVLIFNLNFVESYQDELKALNKRKVEDPFKIKSEYIQLFAEIYHLFSIPYRQLEKFTHDLNKLIPQFPPINYSLLRRSIKGLRLHAKKRLRKFSYPIVIGVDSTGVKVHNSGN